MNNNIKGSTVGSLIVAVAVLALGVGTVAVMVRSDSAQKQQLAAQTQRATYTTFQSEVTAQGIDPSGIINPLTSIATPDTSQNPQANPNINMSMGAMQVAETTIGTGSGGANSGGINVTSPYGTGDRSGTNGTTIIVNGNDTSHSGTSYTLLAPGIALGSTQLTYGDFPAATWFTLPFNPPGTIYRFTTDGSTPDDLSPIWNMTNAGAITPSNFPQTIKIRAFHHDGDYTPSGTTTLGSLTYLLDAPTDGRAAAPSNGQHLFTYSEQAGPGVNGITFSAPSTANGISTTIYYTVDGSNPSSSVTRQVYSGAFTVPLGSWSWNGVLGTPATTTVKAILVGSSGQYVSSPVVTISYSNVPQTLGAPAISVASGTYPVGTVVNLSHPLGVIVTLRYDRQVDPTASSSAGTSTSLQ